MTNATSTTRMLAITHLAKTLHSILIPLAETAAIFLAAYLILLITRFILVRLQRREVFTALAVEHIQRLLALIVYSIAFVSSVYVITNVHEIIYFFIAIIVVILAANWNIIASVSAYYVMLLRREAYRTTLLEFPRLRLRGKIINTTLLFTKLRTPTGKIVYIPNYITISEPIVHLVNIQSIIHLSLRITKPPEISMREFIPQVEKRIQSRLDAEHLVTRAKDIVIKLTSSRANEAQLELQIPVAGFEPRSATLNQIISILVDELRDYNPEISLIE